MEKYGRTVAEWVGVNIVRSKKRFLSHHTGWRMTTILVFELRIPEPKHRPSFAMKKGDKKK
jgi:hypothetical protein